MTAVPAGAKVRASAARVIAAVRFEGVSLRAALQPLLPRLPDPRDRALVEAICFGALRHVRRYEALLARLLQRPLPARARSVHALLLAGLAQLDALKLAPHAALSATAEAARVLGQAPLVGLVNAVLRRYTREAVALDAAPGDDLSLWSNLPPWLIDALRADWGDAALPSLLQASAEEAPLWLRVNRRKTGRDAYRDTLHAAGIETGVHPQLPDALRCDTRLSPTGLPGWSEGMVSVQDGAAQATLAWMDLQPGLRVLDACAAPGGKAAHLLEHGEALDLLALDADPARLQRVRETFARLGLSADCIAGDATAPDDWWDGRPFDRILLDAPCTATGVIRRQPDIALHRTAADVPALVDLQARMLDALWPLLRPGGRLVYATCSLLQDENARQIDAFLARHPDAHALPPADPLGRASGAGRQLWPGDDGMDGFFHAAIGRR